jgi:hypothetical protein
VVIFNVENPGVGTTVEDPVASEDGISERMRLEGISDIVDDDIVGTNVVLVDWELDMVISELRTLEGISDIVDDDIVGSNVVLVGWEPDMVDMDDSGRDGDNEGSSEAWSVPGVVGNIVLLVDVVVADKVGDSEGRSEVTLVVLEVGPVVVLEVVPGVVPSGVGINVVPNVVGISVVPIAVGMSVADGVDCGVDTDDGGREVCKDGISEGKIVAEGVSAVVDTVDGERDDDTGCEETSGGTSLPGMVPIDDVNVVGTTVDGISLPISEVVVVVGCTVFLLFFLDLLCFLLFFLDLLLDDFFFFFDLLFFLLVFDLEL